MAVGMPSKTDYNTFTFGDKSMHSLT